LDVPLDLTVKVPKTLPEYVEDSEIEKIVEWIKNRKTSRNTIDADLTLVMMAMKTGMRRGELDNLTVKDVNLEKNRVYVRGGKGDKDRGIPIHPDLVDGLSRLI
jgi:integrase/recombinase XerD